MVVASNLDLNIVTHRANHGGLDLRFSGRSYDHGSGVTGGVGGGAVDDDGDIGGRFRDFAVPKNLTANLAAPKNLASDLSIKFLAIVIDINQNPHFPEMATTILQANAPSTVEPVRPLANFPPSLWGDRFQSFTLDNSQLEAYAKTMEQPKEEVRRLILNPAIDTDKKLSSIYSVYRLGLAYVFSKDIEGELDKLFNQLNLQSYQEADLYTISIHFQVFRIFGYRLSCDVFNKFKDCNSGEFKEDITTDVRGMLSFYESAQLRIRGESILDDAFAFTETKLKTIKETLKGSLALQVKHALEMPIHRGHPMAEARGYHQEAEWRHSEEVPSFEDYMRVGLITSTHDLLSLSAFMGMGKIVTQEAFTWHQSHPKILTASESISRLHDDVMTVEVLTSPYLYGVHLEEETYGGERLNLGVEKNVETNQASGPHANVSEAIENTNQEKELTVVEANWLEVIAKFEAKKVKPIREKGIADVNKYPYLIRGVDLSKELTKNEENIFNFVLYSGYTRMGDNSKNKIKAIVTEATYEREISFFSLRPNNEPGWVLNQEGVNHQERLDKFTPNMDGLIKGDLKLADLKLFDMVFFPVLEFNHYNLIVFELKNIVISVVDNFHESIPLVGLRDNADYYLKDSPYKVKDVFVQYLKQIQHPKTDDIHAAPVLKLHIPWATKTNVVDCSVFVMRHVEKFMGVREQFNCGFSTNGKKKKSQLNLLTKRFALHLLRSEVNVLRDTILTDARKK
ncbi:hypothetical protein R6Q59_020204 [Mikania micrantha]